MPNLTEASIRQGCLLSDLQDRMTIHQGDCVNLNLDNDTYQVIGLDGEHDRCWVRRWPLESNGGSPVFEISIDQIRMIA